MKYDKLVRDRIPEIIAQKGQEAKTHIAGDREYREKLMEKLQEEVGEFLKSGEREEIADILEVIDAICEDQGFSMDRIKEVKQKKFKERGGFKEKIILEEA